MSPTLDERATTRDPQVTTDVTRSTFLLALHRAIELDGAPAPAAVRFEPDSIRLVMDENAVNNVADWAYLLNVPVEQEPFEISDWRRHTATGVWRGHPLRVSCVAKAGA